MTSLIKGKSTVLLVTHSPALIEEMCSKAVLLDHGRIIARGSGEEISRQYMTMLE